MNMEKGQQIGIEMGKRDQLFYCTHIIKNTNSVARLNGKLIMVR